MIYTMKMLSTVPRNGQTAPRSRGLVSCPPTLDIHTVVVLDNAALYDVVLCDVALSETRPSEGHPAGRCSGG